MKRENENARLLSVLQEVNTNLSILDGTYIYDCRFAGEPWNETIPAPEQPHSLVLLLPGSNWMRNHIQNEIARVLTKGCLVQSGSLIVGDIASEEALTYLAAIQNAWAFTKPEQKYALIELANRTSETPEVVRQKTHLSHSHQVFRDLGKAVSFGKRDGLLFTRMYLPFAHALGVPGEDVLHG